jgi:hypothetical protein
VHCISIFNTISIQFTYIEFSPFLFVCRNGTYVVHNKVDFKYPTSSNNSSPLFDRIGISIDKINGASEHRFVHLDPVVALFDSPNDLDLSLVGARLNGSLAGYDC